MAATLRDTPPTARHKEKHVGFSRKTARGMAFFRPVLNVLHVKIGGERFQNKHFFCNFQQEREHDLSCNGARLFINLRSRNLRAPAKWSGTDSRCCVRLYGGSGRGGEGLNAFKCCDSRPTTLDCSIYLNVSIFHVWVHLKGKKDSRKTGVDWNGLAIAQPTLSALVSISPGQSLIGNSVF